MSHEVSFIEQGYEMLGYWGDDPCGVEDTPVGFIAGVARTCYKSKPRDPRFSSPYSDVRIDAQRDADERLVRALVKNGHHPMLEHSFLSVKFTTNIGVSRELTRHRHFSFAEQSTRYCNYGKKGFEFILPDGLDHDEDAMVRATCHEAAERYEFLIEHGTKPEIARSVLPLATATRIVVSGNFREWRHMLELRTAKDAHPQMRALMQPLLWELGGMIPLLFDDIGEE